MAIVALAAAKSEYFVARHPQHSLSRTDEHEMSSVMVPEGGPLEHLAF